MTETPKSIWETAREHGDQYLLPRRYSLDLHLNEETHARYAACEALVSSGYARWISGYDNRAPGITLTGKPLPEPDANAA